MDGRTDRGCVRMNGNQAAAQKEDAPMQEMGPSTSGRPHKTDTSVNLPTTPRHREFLTLDNFQRMTEIAGLRAVRHTLFRTCG